jgi:D-arabinose 1-dehydrogenase-like Zn-dependent alcohol dehydrogenase
MAKTSKYLKSGGKVVCYGMTASPTISMTMREVMRGQQLIGVFHFISFCRVLPLQCVLYGLFSFLTRFNVQHTFTETMNSLGTMMGSRADLVAATAFLTEHKIIPVVAAVLPGLDVAEEGFQMMQNGSQFGKIVVKIGEGEVRLKL